MHKNYVQICPLHPSKFMLFEFYTAYEDGTVFRNVGTIATKILWHILIKLLHLLLIFSQRKCCVLSHFFPTKAAVRKFSPVNILYNRFRKKWIIGKASSIFSVTYFCDLHTMAGLDHEHPARWIVIHTPQLMKLDWSGILLMSVTKPPVDATQRHAEPWETQPKR
jgi:hypothetical protein